MYKILRIRICYKISGISDERKLPVLMLSQLPRSVELRKNKRPRMDDLHIGFYSGDVAQVIFLYREEAYRGYDFVVHKKSERKKSYVMKQRFIIQRIFTIPCLTQKQKEER